MYGEFGGFVQQYHQISHYFRYRRAPPELTGRRQPRGLQQFKSSHSSRPKKFDPTSWQAPVFSAGRHLRSYQVEGVKWLCYNWHQRCNCILADEMTKDDKVVVLVGTVTNDVRISDIPALRICALRFTEPARAHIGRRRVHHLLSAHAVRCQYAPAPRPEERA
eukprot:822237_1